MYLLPYTTRNKLHHHTRQASGHWLGMLYKRRAARLRQTLLLIFLFYASTFWTVLELAGLFVLLLPSLVLHGWGRVSICKSTKSVFFAGPLHWTVERNEESLGSVLNVCTNVWWTERGLLSSLVGKIGYTNASIDCILCSYLFYIRVIFFR